MAQRQNLDPSKDRALLHRTDSAEKSPGADVPEHPLLTLQHQIGNAQVARMLAQRAGADEDEVQTKRIDRQFAQRAGDEDEVQAKRIDRQLAQRAGEEDEVQTKRIDRDYTQRAGEEDELQMKRIDREFAQRAGDEDEVQTKRIDREYAQRAGDEEDVQAMHVDRQMAQRAGDEEEVQTKRDGDAPVVGAEGGELDGTVSSAIQSRRGGGTPLDDTTRETMESGFGASFSNVRVHTDSSANSLNRQLSAKAFTTGSDIFFSDGAYQPGSSEGRSLLSHELTHVVQQRSMSSSGPMRVSPAGDAHEQEADAMAAKVTSQQSAPSAAQRHPKDE